MPSENFADFAYPVGASRDDSASFEEAARVLNAVDMLCCADHSGRHGLMFTCGGCGMRYHLGSIVEQQINEMLSSARNRGHVSCSNCEAKFNGKFATYVRGLEKGP